MASSFASSLIWSHGGIKYGLEGMGGEAKRQKPRRNTEGLNKGTNNDKSDEAVDKGNKKAVTIQKKQKNPGSRRQGGGGGEPR